MLTTYKLIQGDSVLVAQPVLIQQYGRVGALLIQQIHYWSQKGQGMVHNNQRWIYNTVEQWAEQLCVSASTIKRTVQKLTKDGVIRVQKLAKHKSNQTNSYSINHERLISLVQTMEPVNESRMTESATASKTNEVDTGNVYVAKTRRNAHQVKMTSSSGQNDPMVIQKITNKNKNNKSKDFAHQSVKTQKNETLNEQVQQGEALKSNASQQVVASPSQNIIDSSEKEKVVSSSAIKITTAQDMIDIWNKEVYENKKTINIKLSREISKYLVASYKYKFNEDLDAWKHYCRLIASSPYLMGEGFNLSLSWALKFGTIDRIMAGELGVQLRGLYPAHEKAKSEEEGCAEALRHIDGVGESDGCKEVRRVILRAVGACQYNAWFTKVDISDNGATLKPHNKFVEDYIAGKFGYVLDRVGG